MKHLIDELYKYDEYQSSDKPNAISASAIGGPLYKEKLTLSKTPKDESLIPLMYKRSSTIGTAVHYWAEHVFDDHPDIDQEMFRERQIKLDDITYTISGKCDLVEKQADGTWTLGDWKTGYGKQRTPQALDKDGIQMSVYRWLLQDEYDINDTAYSLFISQSNNCEEAYPVELMSIEATESYIEDRLFAIENNTRVDCQEGIKYNGCTYCSFICIHRKV